MHLIYNEPEEAWTQGYHITKDRKIIKLKLMTDKHLIKTINYFKGKYDITELENELSSRKIIKKGYIN